MRRRPLLLLPALLATAPAATLAAGNSKDDREDRDDRDDQDKRGDRGIRRGRVLSFPRDHGTHLEARTEWWYVTGWLGPFEAPTHGFQVTFFRSLTGLEGEGRFAPRHLLFAHAALTDLRARTHRHAGRIVRWHGRPGSPLASASETDGDVHIGRWRLRREGERWLSTIDDPAVPLALTLTRRQPLLLQGDGGFSRKGPREQQASHYYSEPQLEASSTLGTGRAWLDHEWSDEILDASAVGWDWIGFNLADGSALTAFQLRRADGSTLWAGGSFRPPGGAARSFEPGEVRMVAGRRWTSGATGARYPVEWQVDTPAGRWTVQALLDGQEMDGRGSTGTIYWEGVSELVDSGGRRVGLGYLELTGYAGTLRL